jgi:hypothetical protein
LLYNSYPRDTIVNILLEAKTPLTDSAVGYAHQYAYTIAWHCTMSLSMAHHSVTFLQALMISVP